MGPCKDWSTPTEGTCNCEDGTKLTSDECPACDESGAEELGGGHTADIDATVISACPREYRFDVDEPSVVALVLSTASGQVTLKLKNPSGSRIYTTLSSSSNEAVGSVSLGTGRYVVEVTTTAATSVSFALKVDQARYEDVAGTQTSAIVMHRDGEEPIGELNGLETYKGFVEDVMSENRYAFTLSSDSTLTWQLSDATGRTIGKLFWDTGLVDESKPFNEIVATPGTDATSVIQLQHGSYKLRVLAAAQMSVLYTLGLNAEAYKPMAPANDPGADKNSALDMGVLTKLQEYAGFVGTTDPEDYYRFELKQNASVTFSLSHVLGQVSAGLHADMPLIDETKPAKVYQARENGDIVASENLQKGIYYLRVVPGAANVQALYTLSLTAEGR